MSDTILDIVNEEIKAIRKRQLDGGLTESDIRRLRDLAKIVQDRKNYTLNKRLRTFNTLDKLSDSELEKITNG